MRQMSLWWPGCPAELAAVDADIKAYDALRGGR